MTLQSFRSLAESEPDLPGSPCWPLRLLAAESYITRPQTSFKTARVYDFLQAISIPFNEIACIERLIRRNASVAKNESLTSPLKYCTDVVAVLPTAILQLAHD